MNEDQARSGRDSHASATPRTVFELERDPAWQVTRTPATGRWTIAERTVVQGDHSWRIGLTPITATVVALILWLDDDVVDHCRGTERDLCARAVGWAATLTAGTVTRQTWQAAARHPLR